MKTEEEVKELENEFRELISSGLKSTEDIKQVKERGPEIISELINDAILKDVLKLAIEQKDKSA